MRSNVTYFLLAETDRSRGRDANRARACIARIFSTLKERKG